MQTKPLEKECQQVFKNVFMDMCLQNIVEEGKKSNEPDAREPVIDSDSASNCTYRHQT